MATSEDINLAIDNVTQIADPFHLVKLANTKLDECRRRVQNETVGHRGRKTDPLYRDRRLLTKAHERLDQQGEDRLLGLLTAGDPTVRCEWLGTPKKWSERSTPSPTPISPKSSSPSSPPTFKTNHAPTGSLPSAEPSPAGSTRSSPGIRPGCPTDPPKRSNNLIKRIKRIGFGFRRFANYRIRALLYAGKPNWDLLATITPR